jgi:hypothetical protein
MESAKRYRSVLNDLSSSITLRESKTVFITIHYNFDCLDPLLHAFFSFLHRLRLAGGYRVLMYRLQFLEVRRWIQQLDLLFYTLLGSCT